MVVRVEAMKSDDGWHWYVDTYPELKSRETYESEGSALLAGIHRMVIDMGFEWADTPKRRGRK